MRGEPFTPEWWKTEAFADATDASPSERRAARVVCETHGIRGVCDPGYIANVLAAREAPSGPNPIAPGLESACRFLMAVYPALAEVALADLVAMISRELEWAEP